MNSRRNRGHRASRPLKGKVSSFKTFLGRIRQRTVNLSQISDFSDIENSPAGINEIQKLVGQAGLAAASEAKAVGIPKVFARGSEILREHANGHIEVIVSSQENSQGSYFRHIKPTILHARKK